MMDHLVVMNPDRAYMAVNIAVPFCLGAVADILQVAELRNPDDSRPKKSPDHQFVIVGHVKPQVMAPDGFVKRLLQARR